MGRVVSRLLVPLFALPVLFVACGGGGDAPAVDAGPDAPAASLCATDTRAETFTPGMEASSGDRALRVRLLTIDPAPPNKGENTWRLQVVDAAGAPLDGATIAIRAFMPDHGHGISISPLVDAGGAPGEYVVSRLTLGMPGIWQVTFTVTATGVTEAAVFTFCVIG